MKIKIISSVLLATLLSSSLLAQDKTIVNATSSEISDNLDLRAIASIFGEAQNLEDFERQLNDPKIQISNLDLNDDNQVDYLRVIESVEGNTHLIIVQSVLGRDNFQDVATIEVEKDRNNQVQVQVVGDVYMYGHNYIYEPVYVHTPIIYNSFWITSYRPYSSAWYWNYYPTYYYAWNPYPVFRYRNNINVYINYDNQYNYVNYRRSPRAVTLLDTRRSNYCERQYPNRSFAQRNTNTVNRYQLDQTRTIRNVGSKNGIASNTTRNATPRENGRPNMNGTREISSPRTETQTNTNATRENSSPRSGTGIRENFNSTRETSSPRTGTDIRTNSNSTRENIIQRSQNNESPRVNSNPMSGRNENSGTRSMAPSRNESQRSNSETRNVSQRENQQARNTTPSGNNRGGNTRR